MPERNPDGHSPKWWKKHPEVKAKAYKPVLPVSSPTETKLPWYERNLFWGAATTGISAVFIFLGAVLRDYRWFLIIGAVFGCVAADVAWRSRLGGKRRWIATVVSAVAIVTGMYYLSLIGKPNPPAQVVIQGEPKSTTPSSNISAVKPLSLPVTVPTQSSPKSKKAITNPKPNPLLSGSVDDDCPPGVAVCVVGEGNSVSNVRTMDSTRGAILKGKMSSLDNVIAVDQISSYTATADKTEEFISSVEQYHIRSWKNLSKEDRDSRMSQMEVIKQDIRKVEGSDPKVVEPLLRKLFDLD